MPLFDLQTFVGNPEPLCSDNGSSWLTYGEAHDKILQICESQGLGSDGGKRLVFFQGDNSTQSLLHYIACITAGHAVMLLSKQVSDLTMSSYLDAFNPDTLISFKDGQAIVDHRHAKPLGDVDDSVCLLLSTSGSTGDPKFAKFTAEAMQANALSITEYLDITPSDIALAHLPMNYSFGISIINSHILAGASLVFTENSVMQAEFWDCFNVATSFSGVPFHYEMLDKLRFHRKTFPNLKTLTQAGGALSPTLIQKYAQTADQNGYKFYVMYGQTEAAPRLAYLPPEDCSAHAGKIGKPIPGVTLKIQNPETHAEMPPGQEGELVAFSPSITLGYASGRDDLNLPDSFLGRLATGDLARLTPSGYFEITGRMSRFIKVQGNRVNLAAVETRLQSLDIDAICVGEDDSLFVVVTLDVDAQSVQDMVTKQFEFSPRAFKVVKLETLPRSSSGKPAYAKILEAANASFKR